MSHCRWRDNGSASHGRQYNPTLETSTKTLDRFVYVLYNICIVRYGHIVLTTFARRMEGQQHRRDNITEVLDTQRCFIGIGSS